MTQFYNHFSFGVRKGISNDVCNLVCLTLIACDILN